MGFHFSTKIIRCRRNLPFLNLLLIRPSAIVLISPFSTLSAENPFYPKYFAHIFQECSKEKANEPGRQAHARMIVSGFKPTVIDANCLLQMYVKCSRLECAAKVFDRMPKRTCVSWNTMMFGYSVNGKMGLAQSLFDFMPEKNVVVSWNSLISGYMQNGNCLKSIGVFVMMGRDAVAYNETTLSLVLKAIASLEDNVLGVQIHGAVVKLGFGFNLVTINALIGMYANCRMLNESLQVYVGMLRSGMEPDEFTYSTILKACAGGEALQHGREIHGRVIKCGVGSNSFESSAMIDMYCKCGVLAEAEKLHERMKEQTLVSWNAMISGYSSTEGSVAAHKCFSRMLERGIRPDNFIFATVLSTCSDVADAGLGKQIHAQIIKQSMQSNVRIVNTLLNMYSKCGNMQDSILMFRKSPNRNSVTWSSMVCAYARHGSGNEALQAFEEMLLEKVTPNQATFTGVLRACADIGIVDEALHYFHMMKDEFGLEPETEHYSCLIDALGRCGRVMDALKLIQIMPLKANVEIWTSLLSNCKMHGDVKVAKIAARNLLRLDPRCSSAYVLLSQTYAGAGMWDEASKARRTMASLGLKKKPGCSKIAEYCI